MTTPQMAPVPTLGGVGLPVLPVTQPTATIPLPQVGPINLGSPTVVTGSLPPGYGSVGTSSKNSPTTPVKTGSKKKNTAKKVPTPTPTTHARNKRTGPAKVKGLDHHTKIRVRGELLHGGPLEGGPWSWPVTEAEAKKIATKLGLPEKKARAIMTYQDSLQLDTDAKRSAAKLVVAAKFSEYGWTLPITRPMPTTTPTTASQNDGNGWKVAAIVAFVIIAFLLGALIF